METLSEMFELEIPTVHSIISKMIINEELMVGVAAALFRRRGCSRTRSSASRLVCNLLSFVFSIPTSSQQASLDQPTQTVVMHRTEPTSLQNMALQLAEKLGGLVENNERVFDVKQGVYGGYFNRGALRLKSLDSPSSPSLLLLRPRNG